MDLDDIARKQKQDLARKEALNAANTKLKSSLADFRYRHLARLLSEVSKRLKDTGIAHDIIGDSSDSLFNGRKFDWCSTITFKADDSTHASLTLGEPDIYITDASDGKLTWSELVCEDSWTQRKVLYQTWSNGTAIPIGLAVQGRFHGKSITSNGRLSWAGSEDGEDFIAAILALLTGSPHQQWFPPEAERAQLPNDKARDTNCFIATATFGADSPEVNFFRAYRDDVLLNSAVGRPLVAIYYWASPPIARFLSRHAACRNVIKHFLISLIPVIKK